MVEAGGRKPWYDVHPKQLQATTSSTDKFVPFPETFYLFLRSKEEWEAKKKARADPLTAMNKVTEWFEKKRDEKAREELKLLQRASSCIAAMPSLFPNDISVPKLKQVIQRIHYRYHAKCILFS